MIVFIPLKDVPDIPGRPLPDEEPDDE